jgi:UTP--glucose-1-phosphate uridylyltransferase
MAGKPLDKQVYLVSDFVEKPKIEEAPSNLAIAGRYVLMPEIFDLLESQTPGKNGEIQLTDAMRRLVKTRAMYGLHFKGKRHDIGNKLDFVKTNVLYALKRDDMAKDLRAFLKTLVKPD